VTRPSVRSIGALVNTCVDSSPGRDKSHEAFQEVVNVCVDTPRDVLSRLSDLDRARPLGAPERGRPRWIAGPDGGWVRSDLWETGFVDLAGGQGLLGQVDGRTTAAVRGWLE
jgi:transposase